MNIIKSKETESKELRVAYKEELLNLVSNNKNIVVFDADLANASGTDSIFERYPDQTINAGIAEANMVGMAAGMSLVDKIPFVHTFAPFATRRTFDQLYMSVAYSKANVKIFGSDPGFWAIHNGGTHTSMEDIALMRSLPGFTVLAPSDESQFRWALNKASKTYGNFYIRAGRKKFKNLYSKESEFELGKGIVVEEGKDVVIFAIGEMIEQSLIAKEELKKFNIDVEVVDMFSLKPFDSEIVVKETLNKKLVLSAENHSMFGGLGSAVAEVIAENNVCVPFKRIAVKDRFSEVGSAAYLQRILEIDSQAIIEEVRKQLNIKE